MRKQLSLQNLKAELSQHGGSLKHPQKRKRPLALRSRNHFVLRSSKARGPWSFRRHKFEIGEILKKFARKHHVGLVSYANVGNHIHLQLEIPSRRHYQKFIRAISAAIMIQVTRYSRWNPSPKGFRFWDARPFSRIVSSWQDMQVLNRYFDKNRWQALGAHPAEARFLAHLGWQLRKASG